MSGENIAAGLIAGLLGMYIYLFSNRLARNEIFSRFFNFYGSIKIRDTAENEKWVAFTYRFCGVFLMLVALLLLFL
jgi:hypothetical protein